MEKLRLRKISNILIKKKSVLKFALQLGNFSTELEMKLLIKKCVYEVFPQEVP